MKRFILKTLLLLLPIAALAISMEYLLQHIPNDYVYKKNYLDKHAKDIEILILGASDVYYGIDPVYFSHITFNAAHVSQSLDMNYAIFKKYQNDFNNLKFIVLTVPSFALWSKLEDATDSWRMKNYALYYGIDTKSWEDHSELLMNTLRNNFRRLSNSYIKKENDIYCTELGWGTAYRSRDAVDLEENGKTTASNHTVDIHLEENMKVFAENMQILNSFAEFCNQKNAKLIILTTPTYHTYWENLKKEQLDKMVETLDNFVMKHNNCYYLNWIANPDFVKEDFHDANHLDETGAKKLSLKLVNWIDSLTVSGK